MIWTFITGVLYPLTITGIAGRLFPDQANGSLIIKDGQPIGSALIGQPFSSPGYFRSRPSATSPAPYNALGSTGSNLAPTNPDLIAAVAARVESLREDDPGNQSPVPVDLVTASASGLDPHISPAAAEYQVQRVAKARDLTAEEVRELIARHTESRQFGLFGEPRINVLRLNLALDELGHPLPDGPDWINPR
jgi:K+-transporting ATPase ATPase C chain